MWGKSVEDYAIVKTGGKQYRVRSGDVIRVESLPGYRGDVVELTDVLLVSLDDTIHVGSPTIPGATVVTELVDKGKGKKVIVFKFKAKTRYHRKNGHRQLYIDLKVTDIKVDRRRMRQGATSGT